jgi:hypothetical protein
MTASDDDDPSTQREGSEPLEDKSQKFFAANRLLRDHGISSQAKEFVQRAIRIALVTPEVEVWHHFITQPSPNTQVWLANASKKESNPATNVPEAGLSDFQTVMDVTIGRYTDRFEALNDFKANWKRNNDIPFNSCMKGLLAYKFGEIRVAIFDEKLGAWRGCGRRGRDIFRLPLSSLEEYLELSAYISQKSPGFFLMSSFPVRLNLPAQSSMGTLDIDIGWLCWETWFHNLGDVRFERPKQRFTFVVWQSEYLDIYKKMEWSTVVLNEAQNVRNREIRY